MSFDPPENAFELDVKPLGEMNYGGEAGVNLPILDLLYLYVLDTAVLTQLLLSKAAPLSQGLDSFTEFPQGPSDFGRRVGLGARWD